MARLVETEREVLIRMAAQHAPESWAEDVVHDAWINVQLGRIKPNRTLRTDDQRLEWFRWVVWNEARNRRRTEEVRHWEPLDEILDLAVESSVEPDPFLDAIVAGAVAELPRAQGEVARLRLDGWTLSGIAVEIERSVGTVKRHWYRAREKLRAALRRYLVL